MKLVIFVNNMVCPLLLLPSKKGKNMIKVTKIMAIKKHKKYKNNFVKPNDFHAKKKNVSEKYDKQPDKLKNKFNMLNIDNKVQEELFKTLESKNSSDYFHTL